jgi:signal transduction histidine kinase
LTAGRAGYVAAAALLFAPVVEFAAGTPSSLPHLLSVLLLAAALGLLLVLLPPRRLAEQPTRARDATAADDERRRLVRDIHDGAQQRLVHTIVVLKLARDALDVEAGSARMLIGEALEQAQAANRELRELASGILPPVLRSGGLAAGVRALAECASVPVDVDVSVGRLPSPVEAAAYFVVAEALTNVAKHAQADTASVAAWLDAGMLHAEVRDDGVGGADPAGHGLTGLSDRVAELHGELEVTSSPESGTRLTAAIPLAR